MYIENINPDIRSVIPIKFNKAYNKIKTHAPSSNNMK